MSISIRSSSFNIAAMSTSLYNFLLKHVISDPYLNYAKVLGAAYMFRFCSLNLYQYFKVFAQRRLDHCVDANFEHYKVNSGDRKFEETIISSLMDKKLYGWDSVTYAHLVEEVDGPASPNFSSITSPYLASNSMNWLLSNDSKRVIDQLFFELDNSNKQQIESNRGSLDESDFARIGLTHLWWQIQENLDTNRDNKISLDEFRTYHLRMSLRSRLDDSFINETLQAFCNKSLSESFNVLEFLSLAHHFFNKNIHELCRDFANKFDVDLDKSSRKISGDPSPNMIPTSPRAKAKAELADLFGGLLGSIYSEKSKKTNADIEEEVVNLLLDYDTNSDDGCSLYRETGLSWMLHAEVLRAMDNIYDLLRPRPSYLASVTINKIYPSTNTTNNTNITTAMVGKKLSQPDPAVSRKQFKEFLVGSALKLPVGPIHMRSPIKLLSLAKSLIQTRLLDQLKLIRDKQRLWINLSTELTIRGSTDPSATVTLGRQVIHVEEDGSFFIKVPIRDLHKPMISLTASKGLERQQVSVSFSQSIDDNGMSPRSNINNNDDDDNNYNNNYNNNNFEDADDYYNDDGNSSQDAVNFLIDKSTREKIGEEIRRVEYFEHKTTC